MNEINSESDNLIYEIGFHLLPTVDEADVLAQLSNIKSIIEENGGVVISEDVPKMVSLAYDISKDINSKKQKFSRAYFGWVKFEAESSKIADIKTKTENAPNVLRLLIVKTVRENTMHTPKVPIFKKENGREEREDEHAEKPKLTEAEMDKSIDELVVSQNL